ncbi:MAG: hypothetical protein DDT19_02077 [Syntrophomonadaceae bacterium]|nr:hypothetical protein [Bacillota bacterium]
MPISAKARGQLDEWRRQQQAQTWGQTWPQTQFQLQEPERTVITGLQQRLGELERAGGFLRDVRAPHMTPFTPVTPQLGRITSLAGFLGAGDEARMRGGLQQALTATRGRAAPQAAFEKARLLEGYGRGRADLMGRAYGAAHQMHLGEVGAENVALQKRYEMDLQNAMRQYELDLKRATHAEERRAHLQDMKDKVMLAAGERQMREREMQMRARGGGGGGAVYRTPQDRERIRIRNPYTGQSELLRPDDPRLKEWDRYHLQRQAAQERRRMGGQAGGGAAGRGGTQAVSVPQAIGRAAAEGRVHAPGLIRKRQPQRQRVEQRPQGFRGGQRLGGELLPIPRITVPQTALPRQGRQNIPQKPKFRAWEGAVERRIGTLPPPRLREERRGKTPQPRLR